MDNVAWGWRELRRHFGGWVVLAMTVGLVEVSLYSLLQEPSPLSEERFLGLGRTILGFFATAMWVSITLGIVDNGKLELDRVKKVWTNARWLGVLAILSYLSYWGYQFILEDWFTVDPQVSELLWILLSIPFAFTIPALLDTDSPSLATITQSTRRGLRNYGQIFAIQIFVALGAIVILMPLMCVISNYSERNSHTSWLWMLANALPIYIVFIPWYYLALTRAFRGSRASVPAVPIEDSAEFQPYRN